MTIFGTTVPAGHHFQHGKSYGKLSNLLPRLTLRWWALPLLLATLLVACNNAVAVGEAPVATADLAPDITFTLYQGQEGLPPGNTSLADLRGKPVVLNFWAGLCPPCRAEMPDFQEFSRQRAEQVVVLGIDLGASFGLGSQQDAQALVDELGVTYPTGYPEDPANVARQYRLLGLPRTVFINSEGEIVQRWDGILTRRKLDEIVDKMVSQSPGNTAPRTSQ